MTVAISGVGTSSFSQTMQFDRVAETLLANEIKTEQLHIQQKSHQLAQEQAFIDRERAQLEQQQSKIQREHRDLASDIQALRAKAQKLAYQPFAAKSSINRNTLSSTAIQQQTLSSPEDESKKIGLIIDAKA